jgi:hypothetical protein
VRPSTVGMCGWFFNLRLGLLTQVLAIELLYYFWLLLYDVSGEIAIEGGIPSLDNRRLKDLKPVKNGLREGRTLTYL